MNRTEERHLRRALAVASTSTCRQRHGVVIAHGPRVLAVAVNTNRNNPNICTDAKHEAARHAEWNALRQVRGVDLSKVTLFSARILKDGTPALARPCKNCQSLIDLLEVGKVVYTP